MSQSPPGVVKRGEMTHSAYTMVHDWARSEFGRPQLCENCGSTRDQRYCWANISGQYHRERSDWKRLCYTCHKRYDSGRNYWRDEFCKNGHRLVLTNLKLEKRKSTYLACRECIRTTGRNWARRNYQVKTQPRGYRIVEHS